MNADGDATHEPAAPPRRGVAKKLWRRLRPVLVGYLIVVLIMSFLETWLVYPAPPRGAGDWQPAGLEFEDVWFTAADGTRLHGWFVPHPSPRRAVLYCHGNGEHIAFMAELAAQLRDELTASVFLFDYRGYGHSEGRPNEPGCVADTLAAQRWLANRMGIATSDVVLMGRSLGGAAAVAAAAEQGARALVLENTFSSMVGVAAALYPIVPVRLLMQNRYDSVPRIERYRGPVLQSHGTADRIVPLRFGRELFDAIPGNQKQFIEFPEHGHNDARPRSYWRQVAQFLESVQRSRVVDETAARP